MNALITVTAFVVALAVLIIIHEYGHYLVARIAGVKVLRFSVGFGRPLWLRRSSTGATEWAVCVVPLGGYVKMLDEHDGPVAPEERHRAFNRQSVWRRIAIVSAGPLANFVLAVVLYWMLFLHGVPESKPIVGAPEPGSIAAAAGLQRGDKILKINGETVVSWQDVRWRVLQLAVERQQARFEVLDRSRRIEWRTLELARFGADGFEGDPLARMGLRIYRPDVEPVIDKIMAGGVAEHSGLRSGDRVIAIDGRPVRTWGELVASVRAHPGKRLKLELRRGEEEIGV